MSQLNPSHSFRDSLFRCLGVVVKKNVSKSEIFRDIS
jgi:hypothetical protein